MCVRQTNSGRRTVSSTCAGGTSHVAKSPPSCRQPTAAGSPSPSDVCVWRWTDGRRRIKTCSCHPSSNGGGAPPWVGMKFPCIPVRGCQARVPPSTRPALPVSADAGVKVGTVKDASMNDKHQRRGPAVHGAPKRSSARNGPAERSQFFHSDTFQDQGDGFVFLASSTYEPVCRPRSRRSRGQAPPSSIP